MILLNKFIQITYVSASKSRDRISILNTYCAPRGARSAEMKFNAKLKMKLNFEAIKDLQYRVYREFTYLIRGKLRSISCVLNKLHVSRLDVITTTGIHSWRLGYYDANINRIIEYYRGLIMSDAIDKIEFY